MNTAELENRKQNITTLVTTYYINNSQVLKKKHIELNDAINKALDKYLYSDLSMQEIENEIINIIYRIKNELDDDYNNRIKNDKKTETSFGERIRNNIIFNLLIDDLNRNNIDYTIVGFASAKLAKKDGAITGSIPIIVNDKDVDKVLKICKKHGLLAYDITDEPKRKMVNGNIKGEANISARSEDGNDGFDITPFERLEDGSIITKDHYVNSDGIHCIKADFYANDLAKEIFNSDKVTIDGTTYPIAAPEFTYISSINGVEPEDKEIVNSLEDIVDNDRIEKIQRLAVNKYASQITKNEATKKEQKNEGLVANTDELSSMMENEEQLTNTIVNSENQQKDKPKQFVKSTSQNSSENNGGYVSKLAFIFFLLLIIVLFLTGFLLLNM